jgi:hypothetical protein
VHHHRFHLYHLLLYQEQHGSDLNTCVVFYEFSVYQLQNSNDFFQNVLFTDEASFMNDGQLSLRNIYY